MYWDGNERPAVEAPVGDFFANCFGKRSEVISLPVIVEDADSYNCYLAHAVPEVGPDRDRQPERRSRSACSTTTSTGSRRTSSPKDTPYFYAQYRQEYPVEKGKDYVVLETKGKGHYVGTVLAVRTRSPSWFGEGDEKIYIDGEAKAFDLGHRHGGLFPLGLGAEDHQHALLRRALLRPVGHRGRTHQRLSLASERSARVQQGHQGDAGALRLDFAGRESELQGHELERARGRLRQRGLLVSDRHSRPSRPARRTPASARCPAWSGSSPTRGISPMTSTTAPATRATQQLDLYPGEQLLYTPKQAEGAWLEIPIRGREEGTAAPAAEHDQGRRLRPLPSLSGRSQTGRRDGPLQRQDRQRRGSPARLLA